MSQKNIGTSYGSEKFNDRESINEHETLKNIVLDSEIRDLPDGHFYLKSLNINPVRSRIVKKRWEKTFKSDFCVPAPEKQDVISSTNSENMEPIFVIEHSF